MNRRKNKIHLRKARGTQSERGEEKDVDLTKKRGEESENGCRRDAGSLRRSI